MDSGRNANLGWYNYKNMAIFSKIKKVYQSATKGLQNLGRSAATTVGSAVSKTKQPAAAVMSFPVSKGTDLKAGQKARQAADQKVLTKTYPSGQIPTYEFTGGLQGGNITKGEAQDRAQSAGPTNVYTANSTRLASAKTPGFSAPALPSTITSTSLAGTSGTSGAISLPNFVNAAGGAGALASAMSGVQQAPTNPDGTPAKFDPDTGKPIRNPNEDQSANFFQDYLNELEAPPDTAKLYEKAQREAGLQQKAQEVQNYSSQLNAIQAQAQADQLAVTGQGRGIPEVIIGGQQEQIAKEAAIRALPVAAQLAAAQGNLQLAQQQVDTMFKLLSQDAQNKYEFRAETRKATLNFLTTQEKSRLAEIQKKDDRMYKEAQDLFDAKNKLLQSAYAQGAPQSIKNAIQMATTAQEAIAAAGLYNGTIPKAKSGGSGATINVLDAARYNEQYPDAGVLPGDTEAEANAKVRATLAAPADELRQYLQSQREEGLSYDDVVDSIRNDPEIKDKQAAFNVAGEIYGDTFVSSPSVETYIGDFFRALAK